ncbi:MAG: prepilin-type N-terminal cleavage/methylation domain-containing protein [Lentisphaeraceae bacterium]|nr:prepilin-type N-terminal cleavage/methylation domain-containing protein [Lentisphaeraceae bacterium]
MKKFTLIELLVVVAIIGILASILMPSLSQARLKAQSALCKANLKNMMPAVIMYSESNTDYLPWSQRRAGNVDPHVWWRRQTLTYMSSIPEPVNDNWNALYIEELGKDIFVCPNEKTGITVDYAKGGYGWNLKYIGWGMTSTWAAGAPKKIINSELPAETVIMGDGSDDESLAQWQKLMLLSPSQNNLTGIGNRHFEGMNRLWLDGHVNFGKANIIQSGKGGDSDYFYKLVK